LYHPQQKLKFEMPALTSLSWDKQNRLIETQVKDGAVKLLAINPKTWEKVSSRMMVMF